MYSIASYNRKVYDYICIYNDEVSTSARHRICFLIKCKTHILGHGALVTTCLQIPIDPSDPKTIAGKLRKGDFLLTTLISVLDSVATTLEKCKWAMSAIV